MVARASWWVHLALWLGYAGSLALGRLLLGPDNVSLVWPAQGVGAVILLVSATSTRRVLAVGVGLAALHLLANLLTSAPLGLTLFGTLSGIVEAGVAAFLVHSLLVVPRRQRLATGEVRPPASALPHAGSVAATGPARIGADSTPADVLEPTRARLVTAMGVFLAVVLIACAAGVLVGTAGLTATGFPVTSSTVGAWFARHILGMVLTLGVALLLGHLDEDGAVRLRPAWRRPTTTVHAHRDGLGAPAVETAWIVVWFLVALGCLFWPFPQTASIALLAFAWIGARARASLLVVLVWVYVVVVLAAARAGGTTFAQITDTTSESFAVQLFLSCVIAAATLAHAYTRDYRRFTDTLAASRGLHLRRAQLLSAITDNMRDALVVLDEEGRLVEANEAGRRLIAATRRSAPDEPLDLGLAHPDGTPLAEEDRPTRRALREGTVPGVDLRIPTVDGDHMIFQVSARRLPATGEGDRTLVLAIGSDVTDERERTNRLAEFAQIAAHDIRSPLTAASGWLEMAGVHLGGVDADPVPDPPPTPGPDATEDERALYAVRLATRAVERMDDVLADLLAQATAEGAALHTEEVDLLGRQGLIPEVVAETAPHARIVVDSSHTRVLADPQMLRQLFRNLVGNSAKYMPTGVLPQIAVQAYLEDDRLQVRLTDNGIGIPEEWQERVFSRFTRAHAHLPTYEGTGLGLAIVRSVVERHGGRISCSTPPKPIDPHGGPGTTFAFDLPAWPDDLPGR
ncbi:sensor histidine kinase [Nocardioides bruguierae]|uniref:sensor histidine kinase n=1 Tax=Nocardioides bruguierae TaxID=2945102 RepID=UPI00201FE06A|nr:PAS domain-containing sensor histidine kinase [Nocardioides bruguierae]MCL8025994.1 PAS domain-containing sensor histidine kinase [Nocardioides bruguierae]